MLRIALIAFLLALMAGALGFGGIAAGFASIAQLAFYLFIGLFVISLIMHLVSGSAV